MEDFKEFAGELKKQEGAIVLESLKLVWLWYKRKLKEGYRKREILEYLEESINIIKMMEVYGTENIKAIKQILKLMEEGDTE